MTSPSARLRVAVVEGTPYVGEAIHAVAGDLAHVVGLYATMRALAASDDEPADVVIADIRCCVGAAWDDWRNVRCRWPAARLILLTSEELPDLDGIAEAAGASGWVVTRHLARDLAGALRRAIRPR